MKAYLSFSRLGYQGMPDQDLINLHKIAAFYAKKHFKEVHFVTDTKSLVFFKDIPWSSVSTILDDVPDTHLDVWSLSKLYAFRYIASKKDPFIHIDYDVILWKQLPKRIIDAEVFVQCPEDIIDHVYEIDKFIAYCPNKSLLKDNFPEFSYNMGIFGGNNAYFISKYSEAAINFVLDKNNSLFWQKYQKYSKKWCKAVLAEQYFLAGAARYYNQNITNLFPSWPTEEMASQVGYTHLMGSKGRPDIKERISMRLKLMENKDYN
jgi:hypothetical protein